MTRLISRFALAGASIVALALPASAQMNEDELAAGFAELAGDREALIGLLDAWFSAVSEANEAIYVDYLADIVSQPALASYLYERFPPDEGEDTTSYFARIGYDVSEQVVTAGIARLPTEMQLRYVEFSSGVFSWIMENEPEACGTLANGTIDEMAELESRFQATLTPDEVRSITELNRAAIIAEIEDHEPANNFTDEQMAEAEMAITEAFQARLIETEDTDALMAAAMGQAEDPRAYCELAALTFGVYFDLEEPELGYALQLIFGGGGL